jgi:hypothetical protein
MENSRQLVHIQRLNSKILNLQKEVAQLKKDAIAGDLAIVRVGELNTHVLNLTRQVAELTTERANAVFQLENGTQETQLHYNDALERVDVLNEKVVSLEVALLQEQQQHQTAQTVLSSSITTLTNDKTQLNANIKRVEDEVSDLLCVYMCMYTYICDTVLLLTRTSHCIRTCLQR